MCLLLMPFVYMSLYAQDKQTCVADFSARLYRSVLCVCLSVCMHVCAGACVVCAHVEEKS